MLKTSPSIAAAAVAMLFLGMAPAPHARQDLQDLQDPQDPKKSTGFVLKEGEHDLRQIIQDAAKFLGRNYLTNDQDFGNSPRVTLTKTLNLDAFGCEEVVSQLAYSRDFVMTPVDPDRGIYEFIFARGPKRPEIGNRARFMTPQEIHRRPQLKMAVVTTVHLKNVSATRAAATVRPFFAGGGSGAGSVQIGTAGNDKTILIRGFADHVIAALKLLESVDEAAKPGEGYLDRLGQVEQRLLSLERNVSSLMKKPK